MPAKKLLSTIAIYNDLAFLPSIGENIATGAQKNGGAGNKPGVRIDEQAEIAGWYPREERRSFTPFVRTWDEWDQQTLRRSNKQLKKMFKEYYNSREFGDFQDEEQDNATQLAIQSLREKFRLAPGQRILPWWKRRNLRSNPFNANEQLCKNRDE
jgi:hypothetical protein